MSARASVYRFLRMARAQADPAPYPWDSVSDSAITETQDFR